MYDDTVVHERWDVKHRFLEVYSRELLYLCTASTERPVSVLI